MKWIKFGWQISLTSARIKGASTWLLRLTFIRGFRELKHARQHGYHFAAGRLNDGGVALPPKGLDGHPLASRLAVWQ